MPAQAKVMNIIIQGYMYIRFTLMIHFKVPVRAVPINVGQLVYALAN